MVFAKICGITSIEEARQVAAAGADMLGFHISLEHSRNPITPQKSQEIIAALPEGVASVMVTTEVDPQKIVALAKEAGVSAVQLHGDVDPAGIHAIKTALPYLKAYKVINVGDVGALLEAERYEGAADAILLDSAISPEGQRGGTGKTHDWKISRSIVESQRIPVILAGGLNAENVADAIRTVHPYAVDVNSGVSNPDGTKNIEKVQAFIAAAKAA